MFFNDQKCFSKLRSLHQTSLIAKNNNIKKTFIEKGNSLDFIAVNNKDFMEDELVLFKTLPSNKRKSIIKKVREFSSDEKTYDKTFAILFNRYLKLNRINIKLNLKPNLFTRGKNIIYIINNALPCSFELKNNFSLHKRYIWLDRYSSYNLKIKNLLGKLKNLRNPNFPNSRQKDIMRSLSKGFIYVLYNDWNKIIMAHPDCEIIKSFNDRLYDKYSDFFHWQHDKIPVSINLMFFNIQDAEELKYQVEFDSPLNSHDIGVNIKPLALDKAYFLSRTSPPRVHCKFAPDFLEMANVIKKYRYYSNINTHQKQKIGRTFFQGQPIYIVRLNILKTSILNKVTQDFLEINNNKNLIFTSFEILNQQWKIWRKKYPDLCLSSKPKILIYNLESFLQDCEIGCEDSRFRFFNTIYDNHIPIMEKHKVFDNKIMFPPFIIIKIWSSRMIRKLLSGIVLNYQ